MAEENQVQQVTKKPQQVKQVTKEAMQPPSRAKPAQRVTTKNPKKVEVGRRLAAHNHKKREERRKKQYYGIGAILALAVICGLGYYIYQSKKGQVSREVKDVLMPYNPPQQPHPQVQAQTNKFEMD